MDMNIRKIQCINGIRAFVAAMLLATVWVVPAVAASDKAPDGKDAGKRLEEVKRALGEGREKARQLKNKAQAIERDLATLRRDMVAAAHIIQEQERRATGLVKALVKLKAEEQAKLARLAARRVHLLEGVDQPIGVAQHIQLSGGVLAEAQHSTLVHLAS